MKIRKRSARASVAGTTNRQQAAQESGYAAGWSSGYYMGRCEAVIRSIPAEARPVRKVRMLYVTSGKGMPYSPLDESIVRALRPLVSELYEAKPQDDIVAQATRVGAELVLVLEGMLVPPEQIERLRKLGVRTAVWLTDDPYYTDITSKFAPSYDYVFTLELSCVPFYEQLGCSSVHYLPFCADVSIYRPMHVILPMRRDVGFAGSAYWRRVAFFDQIAPSIASMHMDIVGIWWDRLAKYPQLSHKIQLNRWMSATETAQFYNGSKIAINLHRAYDDVTYNYNSRLIPAYSPNPRTFEIAATGALLMTDMRDDLQRFYAPGTEIVTYSTPNELLEKIHYYLQHEEERQQIALRGMARTFREHSYEHRLNELLQTIMKDGNGGAIREEKAQTASRQAKQVPASRKA